MAAALVGGAALGTAFQVLVEEVRKLIKKAGMCKKMMEKLMTKLEKLEPLIKQITELNMELDRQHGETLNFEKVISEGLELVRDYPKGNKWLNLRKKARYTKKLSELDESLDQWLKLLQAYGARDNKEILKLVRIILAAMGRTETSDLGYRPISIKGQCDVPEPPSFTVGLDLPLKELKMKLLGDDDVSVLVLTAPPGCGKTTLAEKLCKDEEIKDKFKSNILFVKVSKNPDFSQIVQELHQHKGYAVPSQFKDKEDAINRLEYLLRNVGEGPILLVLDDVWSGSESLIENFSSFQIPEYKILVTTRFPFKRFKQSYELKGLSDEDAMKLFCHYASLEDGNSNIPNVLVKEVVDHCKKVPLALKLIGSSLSGERQEIWRRELKRWSTGSSILSSEGELLACLQSSIDVLGEKDVILKECFMDLGSFPEDRRIPATAFIDVWTQLHELEEDDAIDNLFYLSKWNMANVIVTRKDVEEQDDYYSEHFLTQHDMLRELAIHQSRQDPDEQRKRLIVDLTGNDLPKWWKIPKDQPLNARLLSISTDGSFSSEWCDLKLPEGEVLILNFQTKNYAFPEFVKNMSKLKVLVITNYGFFPAKISNLHMLGSSTNVEKIRLERIEIPSLSETPINFENLKKLSLFMCKVGQAFKSVQISEAFPNLEEINVDYCNDLEELPAGFCNIVKLKKLSITHCHKLSALPEEIEKLVNLEVLRIRSCIDLTKLPDSICKLFELTFLDISDCFSLRNLPENIGKLRSLTKLDMKNCSRLQELPPSVLDFEQLEDVVCDEEIKELWKSYLSPDAKIELRVAKEDINLNWLEA